MNRSRVSVFCCVLTIALVGVASAPGHADDGTWTGATDQVWATNTNWLDDPVIVPGTGNTATFNGDGNGNTNIDLGAGVTIQNIVFDTASAAAYTIGDASSTLTLNNAGAITINGGVTANQAIGVSGGVLSLSNAAGATTTFTNNGSGLLTIGADVVANVASGNGLLTVLGTGNTTVTGTITKPGAGNNALMKTDSGTLRLTSNSTWNGTGASSGGFSGPLIAQAGTLLFDGGTHTVTGEAVIGGVIANGGVGNNATIQVDSGALNISTWLSVGRGNGVGGVNSDLVINGSATVSTLNLSAGFNGGSGDNLPMGSITLNNTSNLTVNSTATGTAAGAATFMIGESGGSDFTMTVNDSATVNRTGGNITLGNNDQAALQIGRDGTGTLIMNGGTINVASTDLGRGVGAGSAQNGTLTINTGATYNNQGDFRTGFAGGANGQGTLNLQGGTLNIGTTVARTLIVGTWDSSQSTLNVSSGSLNLNTNSSIRFNQSSGIGAKEINLTGGAITSYSDNQITANGSGVLDMMQAGAGGSNNTFNLNGGTLTIRQVVSTTNNGTRTFNFNGGTLRATGATADFFNLGTGTARANVRNGGAVIDTNGNAVTIAQALEHSNIGGDNAIDGGLAKTGSGRLSLAGVNTYTGITTISGGTLEIASTGSIDGTSGVTINGGELKYNGSTALTAPLTFTSGTISGTGTIASALTVGAGATLSPGNSPGIQGFTGDQVWAADGNYNWQILDATGSAGTGFDQIQITGELTVASGFNLNLWSLSSIDPDVSGDALNFDNTSSFQWIIATTTDGIVDAANLAFANIFVGASNGTDGFSNSLGGGSFSLAAQGNNVVLSFHPVPEPSTVGLGLLSATVVAVVIRRRGRNR